MFLYKQGVFHFHVSSRECMSFFFNLELVIDPSDSFVLLVSRNHRAEKLAHMVCHLFSFWPSLAGAVRGPTFRCARLFFKR